MVAVVGRFEDRDVDVEDNSKFAKKMQKDEISRRISTQLNIPNSQ